PRRVAQHVVEVVRAVHPSAKTLLDLGSGPGLVTGAILPELGQLRATLVDRPAPLEQAGRLLRYLGARIELVPCDFANASQLSVTPADVALISDVLHTLSRGDAASLVETAHRSLVEGGVVIVAELPADSIEGAFCGMAAALLQSSFDVCSIEDI